MAIKTQRWGLLFVLSIGLGCTGEEQCSTVRGTDCQALYMPTYENVFEMSLKPTCGQSGMACHAPEGAQGGLIISDIETSYTTLTDQHWVYSADVACSPLIMRLESDDLTQVMPPGAPLSAQELCAIETWIANGAQR